MKLVIFNGSPKKGKNNTAVLTGSLLKGFTENAGNSYEEHRLNGFKSLNEAVEIFKQSEYILLAFPLYSYSMPAGVMEFIEALEPLCGKCAGKKIGYLVQFGFPEAVHARALEKYQKKLTERLGAEYLGTIIKGGCNNLSIGPERFFKKILNGAYEIGRTFGKSGKLDKNMLDEYSKPENQTKKSRLKMKLFCMMANKFYWGAELKKNGAYDRSFARPYAQ